MQERARGYVVLISGASLLLALGCGGGALNGAPPAVAQSAPEQRRGPPRGAAAMQGTTILVDVETPLECRSSGESDWKPCGADPAQGASLILDIGGREVPITTDAKGRATLDLARDGLLSDARRVGAVNVILTSGTDRTVLGAIPVTMSKPGEEIATTSAARVTNSAASSLGADRARQAKIIAAFTSWVKSRVQTRQDSKVTKREEICVNNVGYQIDCRTSPIVWAQKERVVVLVMAELQNRSGGTLRCFARRRGENVFANAIPAGDKVFGTLEVKREENAGSLLAATISTAPDVSFDCLVLAPDILRESGVTDDVRDAFGLQEFKSIVFDITVTKDVHIKIGDRTYRSTGSDYEMVQ